MIFVTDIFGLDKMDINGNIIGNGTEGDGKIDLSPNCLKYWFSASFCLMTIIFLLE